MSGRIILTTSVAALGPRERIPARTSDYSLRHGYPNGHGRVGRPWEAGGVTPERLKPAAGDVVAWRHRLQLVTRTGRRDSGCSAPPCRAQHPPPVCWWWSTRSACSRRTLERTTGFEPATPTLARLCS